MGCTISPILFMSAFEVILVGARQMVGGIKTTIWAEITPTVDLHG